jgi:hypothetical protein
MRPPTEWTLSSRTILIIMVPEGLGPTARPLLALGLHRSHEMIHRFPYGIVTLWATGERSPDGKRR